MTVIGLMSGAGLEGIDVALVATDGARRLERRHSLTFPLTPEQRESLSEAIATGRAARIEQDLVAFCADAVKHFLECFALARDAVAHRPSERDGEQDVIWRGAGAGDRHRRRL
jgi:1,6-anhydro-N-acetylmuramate kinase